KTPCLCHMSIIHKNLCIFEITLFLLYLFCLEQLQNKDWNMGYLSYTTQTLHFLSIGDLGNSIILEVNYKVTNIAIIGNNRE
ncbi:hypothetical protein ACQP3L_35625, partial [Escherichia coli]